MRRFVLVFVAAMLGSALAQQTEQAEPTILSRGLGTVLQGGGDLLRLRPYVSLTGMYETGLISPTIDASGKIPETAAYGGSAELGVAGYRRWRRTVLGLDYRGDFRHYTQKTYYDGSNHTLMLGVTHEVSRSLTFSFREAAGTHSRNPGFLNGYTFFDARYANVPSDELFNGRTNYLVSMGDLTYSVGRRLSFNLGGNGMVVRRRSAALVGLTGYTARGDMQYRVSRFVSLGVDYSFNHYGFTRSFGSSDFHTVGLDLALQLGRSWNMALQAGGSRLETLGTQTVAVDPIIAAITGQSSGQVVMYRLGYVPVYGAKLSRAFRRSTISFDAQSGVSPGNGIYLTSRQTSGGAGFSHTASQKWNIGASVNYSQYGGVMQTIGKYRSYGGGGGVTYQLRQSIHLVARYDARQYEVEQSIYGRRMSHVVSLGLAFSPGELPLSLW